MTGLRGRIARIEERNEKLKGRNTSARRKNMVEALGRKLERLERLVVESGDASDKPGQSLMERTVRRYLRGDAEPAKALSDLLAGRWP